MAGMAFNVVGGCEIDPTARREFQSRHPNAVDYGSVENFLDLLDNGELLPPIHVISGTMPCRGRSRLARLNREKTPPSDTHLFNLQLELVAKIKPTVFFAEMVSPSVHDNEGKLRKQSGDVQLQDDMARVASYVEFEDTLSKRLHYDLWSGIFNFAKHGAFTDRQRYIACAFVPAEVQGVAQPAEQEKFAGLHKILDAPWIVDPSLRADCFTLK